MTREVKRLVAAQTPNMNSDTLSKHDTVGFVPRGSRDSSMILDIQPGGVESNSPTTQGTALTLMDKQLPQGPIVTSYQLWTRPVTIMEAVATADSIGLAVQRW